MRSFSLTRRVIFLSSAWTMVAIALLGWLLLAQFRAGAERNFAELQKAQLFSLIGAVGLSERGELDGAPNLGDTSFLVPESGWFWRVSVLESELAALGSPSLSGFSPASPSREDVPFDEQFTRDYIVEMPDFTQVRIYEAEIDLGSDVIGLFQVGGNQSEFDSDIRSLALRTSALLAVFGLGVVAINSFILLFGLRPLDRIRQSLTDIRAGRSGQLEGAFPTEIEPMVLEMNTLISKNRDTVERARTQVGNLAHSLKTPIAVLTNEADVHAKVDARVVKSQADAMDAQVQHYLSRARIAAQSGTVAFQTDAVAAAQKLINVMRKLNPDKNIALTTDGSNLRFAGEKEDFEEILGNVLENACKWADRLVEISLGIDEFKGLTDALTLVIDDDGPGIAAEMRINALKRGQRLDETTPGSGLGLAIVSDTVSAYAGEIVLGDSHLGGLKVIIRLPSVNLVS